MSVNCAILNVRFSPKRSVAGCACAETTLQTAAQAKTIGRFMFGE